LSSRSGVTRAIPFDWTTHFCPNTGTDCVPACFVMAAKYWKSLRPDLNLPTEPKFWDDFLTRTSAKTPRGTSLWRLLRNVRSVPDKSSSRLLEEEGEEVTGEGMALEVIEVSNLVLDPRTPKSIRELRSPLEDANPPLPQILAFDKTMMTHRTEGVTHAVLLLQIDFVKEKLYVVDPTLGKRMEPTIYDFGDFSRGWGVLSNLDILVYPKGTRVVSGMVRSLLSYLGVRDA